VRKDGEIRHLSVSRKAVVWNGGLQFLTTYQDITERKRAEETLKESEEKLQAILTGIGDLITIQNKDLDIIWANKPMQEIYGDVIGKKCYRIYKGLEEKCPDCTVERVLVEEKSVVTQRPSILPDGRTMHILTTSSPIRDAKGNITAVVEVVKDITERKELERQLIESEKRYRGLYESSIDGILSAGMDNQIIECNHAFAEMLGYTKDELHKLNTSDITPSTYHDKVAEIITEQVIARGYSDEFETELLKKDGTLLPVPARIWLIKDEEGNPAGTWGIVHEITERKLAEETSKNGYLERT
jgi:PAS domain S-box-containing protein